MSTEKVKASALAVQTLATLSIACLTALTGFVYAWPSYTVLNFMSNDTQLSAPMTPLQNNLLGSVTNIGALVTTPLCGYMVNTLGRKYSAILFGIPFVLAWTIISVTKDINVVLVAMTLAGVGAAGQAVSSVYICEIAQDSIRGGLASSTVTCYFAGLLISYILEGYLTYHQVLYTHLILSVLYMVMLTLLKESPVFLLQKGKEEEAAKSIAFYQRVSLTSKEVENELNKIKLQLDPRIEKFLQGEKVGSESSKRALCCVLTLMTISMSMGSIVLQVYAEPLMKEATPTIPSNLAAIILAVVFLFSSATGSVIVDRFGRKGAYRELRQTQYSHRHIHFIFLLMNFKYKKVLISVLEALMTYSSLASGVGTLLLGIQIKYYFLPNWVTAVIIYAYSFIFNIGAATVPAILTAEVFLPEVRGLCNSMSMGCMWIMNFVTLIFFNPLVELIGLGEVFCCFSAVCIVGAMYSQFYLPETKGLSADAIQLLFLKKTRTRKSISGA